MRLFKWIKTSARQTSRPYTPFYTPHKGIGEIPFMLIAVYASFARKRIAATFYSCRPLMAHPFFCLYLTRQLLLVVLSTKVNVWVSSAIQNFMSCFLSGLNWTLILMSRAHFCRWQNTYIMVEGGNSFQNASILCIFLGVIHIKCADFPFKYKVRSITYKSRNKAALKPWRWWEWKRNL